MSSSLTRFKSPHTSFAHAVEFGDWKVFVPGPVPIESHLLAIGNQQLPYNRTEAFSEITHEIQLGLLQLFQTEGSVALLTASGTAAMEAAAINFLDVSTKVLVVNGGTFGQRWSDLCTVHSIPFEELCVPPGADIDLSQLESILLKGRFSALLINAHETSTGHLYDIEAIGKIVRTHGCLFVVDAISSICADPFTMDAWGVDVCILSSQKALALPPGLSFVALNRRSVALLEKRKPKSLYFNLKDYLANQLRGQSPYTPAIGLMLQLHQRLADIQSQTLPVLVAQHKQRAEHFRHAIQDLAFAVFPSRCSNAMTALACEGMDAGQVVERLRDHYRIIVAPGAGSLKSKTIRVAHMGAQNPNDVGFLTQALAEINATSRRTKR